MRLPLLLVSEVPKRFLSKAEQVHIRHKLALSSLKMQTEKNLSGIKVLSFLQLTRPFPERIYTFHKSCEVAYSYGSPNPYSPLQPFGILVPHTEHNNSGIDCQP